MSNGNMPNISEVKKVHFVGVGGIGMSALARLFLHDNKQVTGSDKAASAITEKLEEEGVVFFDKQLPGNIGDDVDLVVYTEAMPNDHGEILASKEKKISTISYFEALGLVANQYYLIAVSGTHGKTTTTAMLIDIFEAAGLDPTAIVGSLRGKTGSNFKAGKHKYFIAEACEYKRDFLYLEPDILVITNVETEHVDYYKDLEDVQSAFHELAMKVPEEGYIVCNTKDDAVKPVVADAKAKIVSYTHFFDPLLKLKQRGTHNYMNAAAALAVGDVVGVDEKVSKETLEQFVGTWRRCEYKGRMKTNALVFDDYGHHPTEISTTLRGIRDMEPKKKLIVIFEPHTYTRTHRFFDEFVDALSVADEVMLVPIYAAREDNVSGVSSEKLAESVRKNGTKAAYFETFDEVEHLLRGHTDKDDVVVTMGAGDVYKIAESLTN